MRFLKNPRHTVKKTIAAFIMTAITLSTSAISVSATDTKLATVKPVYTPGNVNAGAFEDILNYTYPQYHNGLNLSDTFEPTYDPRTLDNDGDDKKIAGWAVRDQGNEGNCWTFAATAAREAWEQKTSATGVFPVYSENHMAASLYKNSELHPWTFTNTVLEGGNREMATAYFTRGSGPVRANNFSEDVYNNYFYVDGIAPGYNEEPNFRNSTRAEYNTLINSVNSTNQVANALFLTGDAGAYDIYVDRENMVPYVTYNSAKSNINTIKDAIVKYGAVMASYCSAEGGLEIPDLNFNINGEDYFKPSTSAYCLHPSDDYTALCIASGYIVSNHAISIVGWDDTYSASNFASLPDKSKISGLPESLDGAWIVRNSWGEDGTFATESGYEYISYYDYFIGQSAAAFPGKIDKSAYINQYDGLCPSSSITLGTPTADVMNKFTTSVGGTATEYVNAVGVYVTDANTKLKLRIDEYIDDTEIDDGDYNTDALDVHLKKTFDASDSNVIVEHNTMTVKYPGYYVMEFENPVLVHGEYEIIVTYENINGEAVNIACVSDSESYAAPITEILHNGSHLRPDEQYAWINAYESNMHVPIKTYNTLDPHTNEKAEIVIQPPHKEELVDAEKGLYDISIMAELICFDHSLEGNTIMFAIYDRNGILIDIQKETIPDIPKDNDIYNMNISYIASDSGTYYYRAFIWDLLLDDNGVSHTIPLWANQKTKLLSPKK